MTTTEQTKREYTKHPKSPWTDETIERLLSMNKEGRTRKEIADALNVSENAISGKLHRILGQRGELPKKPNYCYARYHKTMDIKQNECRHVVGEKLCKKTVVFWPYCKEHFR